MITLTPDMKLHKLTIHNIASIEDAVIDFSAEPLSDSEVFLITGKTGSGKSTILDAICLALYATTPRLASNRMQGEAPDAGLNIKMYDPRQLLRRNTGEGYVALTFTGNNNRRYEAQWSVARARSKPDKRLQSKNWALTDIDRNITYGKDAEIRDEIANAVGLDFDQFCRTTILAQGEFTRFLNSNDEDKAAILEKITGVDIYGRIGQRIFELTRDCRDEYDKAKSKVDDVALLSPEQKAALNTRIGELAKEESALVEQRKSAEVKRVWLTRRDDLVAQRATADTALADVTRDVESADFKRQEAVIADWHATITPRQRLRQQTAADKELEAIANAAKALAGKYDIARAAYAFLEDRLDDENAALDDVNKRLADEAPREAIYDNRQTLSAYLKTIIAARDSIVLLDKELKDDNTLLDKRQKAKDDADEVLKAAQTALANHAEMLKDKEDELEKAGLSALRDSREKEHTLQGDIDAAARSLEDLLKERDRRQKESDELQALGKSIGETRQQITALLPQVNAAKHRFDELKAAYEAQNNSADKWAKAMRIHLHQGDTCPLCRQTIAGMLPTEDEIAEIVRNAKRLRDEAETEYNEIKERVSALETEVKVQQSNLDKRMKTLADDSEEKSLAEQAERRCKSLAVTDLDTAVDDLARLKNDGERRLTRLNTLIAQGEALEEVIKPMRKKAETLRGDLDKAKAAVDAVGELLAEVKSKIETATTLRGERQRDAEQAMRVVDEMLDGSTGWQHDRHNEPKAFDDELKAATTAYCEARQKSLDIAAAITQHVNTIKAIQPAINDIESKMPQWRQRPVGAPRQHKEPAEYVRQLANDVTSLTERQRVAYDGRREAADALGEYLSGNGAVTVERLTTLDAIDEQQIAELKDALQKKRDDITSLKGQLKQCDENLRDHDEKRPALVDDENVESLTAQITALDEALEEHKEMRIELKNRLIEDDKSRERVGQLMRVAERKRDRYMKWERLNKLFGDATGKNFRRIAQSFILENLIHIANAYMRQLTDRYTLHIVPGQFVITIEDAYQGYVSRAAGTLSGGESFLVSLALALALSDIGERLAVDTLFIDEGFGSLSGEPLNNAIATLRDLHNKAGRHVGIISHVADLREHIPVQIQVRRDAKSSSATITTVVT